jgi:thiol:disulfide interchange protein DsbA
MKRLLLAFVALFTVATVQAQTQWQAGRHYTLIPVQRTQVPPGKIEVLEVFSYGCPACNTFRPAIKEMQAKLPRNAQIAYLPASWNTAENWPTFQRAYITAQQLGVADKAHEAMYDAIWTHGQLAVLDRNTGRPLRKLPSMEDVAKFYEKTTGVKAADFVAASRSFTVDTKIRQAESQIKAMGVASTPTMVVNGKYRVNTENLRTMDEIIGVISFLVAKESTAGATKKP